MCNIKRKPISFNFNSLELADIDKLAKIKSITRGEMVRNIVNEATRKELENYKVNKNNSFEKKVP